MLNDEQQNFIIRSMKNNPNFRAFVDGRSELSHDAMKDIVPRRRPFRSLPLLTPGLLWSGRTDSIKRKNGLPFFADILYNCQSIVYVYMYIYVYIHIICIYIHSRFLFMHHFLHKDMDVT